MGTCARKFGRCISLFMVPALLSAYGTSVASAASGRPATAHRAAIVTLITGDKVSLDGGTPAAVSVQPRAGRENIKFITRRISTKDRGEQIYVLPADALPLIGADRLDESLFDVMELADSRFDDASRPNVPLVITYQANTMPVLAAGAPLAKARLTRRFEVFNGSAGEVDKAATGQFWDALTGKVKGAQTLQSNPVVQKIWLDKKLELQDTASATQIGAPAAWTLGIRGQGVAVAVIDTGVDGSHPDLAGKVVAARNFTDGVDYDTVGHGTHVASIIAGTGAASAGQVIGVAPQAQIIAAKACDGGCRLSSVLAAMEWAVIAEGARIVNMSFGTADTLGVDPLEQQVNDMTERFGTLFVCGAGNNGAAALPGIGTLISPATADAALAVGAVERNDQIWSGSSRGPRRGEPGVVKPEITAPGVDIVGAYARGTLSPSEIIQDVYVTKTGTSQAAPHVAGAAALLLQRNPHWSAAELKAALIGSATPTPGASLYAQGAGRVDVAAAFAGAVIAQPATLNLGTAPFPHTAPITRVITYKNIVSAPITLTLDLNVAGLNGESVAPGAFMLTPTTLSISPGQSATATLTVNAALATLGAIYTGGITARASNGALLRTPLALSVEAEAELYDVELQHLDSTGTPTAQFVTTLIPLDERLDTFPSASNIAGGVVTLRVPRQRYHIESLVGSGTPGTIIVKPVQVVAGPTRITLDGSQAQPLSATLPIAGLNPRSRLTLFTAPTVAWGSVTQSYDGSGMANPAFRTLTLGHPEPADFESTLLGSWNGSVQTTEPGSVAERPPVYLAAFSQQGALLQGAFAVDPTRLASVDSTYLSPSANLASAQVGIDSNKTNSPPTWIGLPFHRIEHYFSADPQIRWMQHVSFIESASGAPGAFVLNQPGRAYQPGQAVSDTWGQAPFAPAFPVGGVWAERSDDRLSLRLPMFSDRNEHDSSAVSSGTCKQTLFGNGAKVGDADCAEGTFDVGSGNAAYRLEATATQTTLGLSTQVSGAWTFTSQTARPAAQIPLMSVRLRPPLDVNNHGAAGATTVPISVHQIGQPGAIALGALTIQASFDDGRTWVAVPVTATDRQRTQWVAQLTTPADASFVSFKAAATDLHQNTVELTVVRAYALSAGQTP